MCEAKADVTMKPSVSQSQGYLLETHAVLESEQACMPSHTAFYLQNVFGYVILLASCSVSYQGGWQWFVSSSEWNKWSLHFSKCFIPGQLASKWVTAFLTIRCGF